MDNRVEYEGESVNYQAYMAEVHARSDLTLNRLLIRIDDKAKARGVIDFIEFNKDWKPGRSVKHTSVSQTAFNEMVRDRAVIDRPIEIERRKFLISGVAAGAAFAWSAMAAGAEGFRKSDQASSESLEKSRDQLQKVANEPRNPKPLRERAQQNVGNVKDDIEYTSNAEANAATIRNVFIGAALGFTEVAVRNTVGILADRNKQSDSILKAAVKDINDGFGWELEASIQSAIAKAKQKNNSPRY